jgi:hypothetical protein
MSVSQLLRRRFFWFENVLRKTGIEGRNVTVSLTGKDLIVNAEAVRQYLTSSNLSRAISKAEITLKETNADEEAKIPLKKGAVVENQEATEKDVA